MSEEPQNLIKVLQEPEFHRHLTFLSEPFNSNGYRSPKNRYSACEKSYVKNLSVNNQFLTEPVFMSCPGSLKNPMSKEPVNIIKVLH